MIKYVNIIEPNIKLADIAWIENSCLPYLLVYKLRFWDVKIDLKIDLDLYTGKNSTVISSPNLKKYTKISLQY